ncbi:MAG TPA: hypothetical protein DFS52_22320 [Myxococcales bacterium]|nr:hypothetical protein [Myxococcales bacterium]
MAAPFDAEAIEKHGWRQGAVLGPELLCAARERAPQGLLVRDEDWLIITSHDCDIANARLDKEPVVEVLRAEVNGRKAPDRQQAWGRNPRLIQLDIEHGGGSLVLCAKVHERWMLPRELLCAEAPARILDDKTRRLVAEWLVKRYIRAAFPTAFDARWRARLRDWTDLLGKHSRSIQGVYLRLNTLSELEPTAPYIVDLIVAVPVELKSQAGWAAMREQIERELEAFWEQFAPGIECQDVDVLATDEVTLAAIEHYQRFDTDWVSFAEDSPTTPVSADMRG